MQLVSPVTFASMVAGIEATGMSRTEIAQATGLSRTTVWRIAEGEAREPGYQTISSLQRLYENRVPVLPMKQKQR